MIELAHRLHAGPISCDYVSGSLRRIRVGDCPILLHIYFALRDHAWATIPLCIEREEIQSNNDNFSVDLEVSHNSKDIDFRWRGGIRGSSDGRITYSVAGEAHSSFWRNRIGLCVLHSAQDCRGLKCSLTHTGNSVEQSGFPDLISPHQPFLDLAAITYAPKPGITAEVRFTGDIFETEDQRNWSDASFKTYSTPLAIPYPQQVNAGDTLRQEVSLRITGQLFADDTSEIAAPALSIREGELTPMPEIGVVWDGEEPSRQFSFLHVDLDLAGPEWQIRIERAAACELKLQVSAVLQNIPQLEALYEALGPRLSHVKRLLLFNPETHVSEPGIVSHARRLFKGLSIGAGSNRHFAELNRNRRAGSECDFIVWPIDPQVHATDRETIFENLAGQTPSCATSRTFSGCPIHIAPVTVPEMAAAACWTLVTLKQLASIGVRAVTFSRPSLLLEEICRFQAHSVIACNSTRASHADALVLENGEGRSAWIANLLPVNQDVHFGDKALSLKADDVVRLSLGCQ